MSESHWTEQLFLEHADIFLRVHEDGIARAEQQVRDLVTLLERQRILPPASILDAPCGIGRHAVRLAKAGFRVTGLDFAPKFLERAERLAGELGGTPKFVLGDLREVRDVLHRHANSFSAILNLWTSLGYWGEETDLDILRQFHTLAAPGGLLVVETINRDYLMKYFQSRGWEEFGDLVLVEDRHWDPATSWMRAEWRFYRRRGENLVHEATIPVHHRAYASHELKDAADAAGWHTLGVFGSLTLDELTPDRSRLVLVARKEGP